MFQGRDTVADGMSKLSVFRLHRCNYSDYGLAVSVPGTATTALHAALVLQADGIVGDSSPGYRPGGKLLTVTNSWKFSPLVVHITCSASQCVRLQLELVQSIPRDCMLPPPSRLDTA